MDPSAQLLIFIDSVERNLISFGRNNWHITTF